MRYSAKITPKPYKQDLESLSISEYRRTCVELNIVPNSTDNLISIEYSDKIVDQANLHIQGRNSGVIGERLTKELRYLLLDELTVRGKEQGVDYFITISPY